MRQGGIPRKAPRKSDTSALGEAIADDRGGGPAVDRYDSSQETRQMTSARRPTEVAQALGTDMLFQLNPALSTGDDFDQEKADAIRSFWQGTVAVKLGASGQPIFPNRLGLVAPASEQCRRDSIAIYEDDAQPLGAEAAIVRKEYRLNSLSGQWRAYVPGAAFRVEGDTRPMPFFPMSIAGTMGDSPCCISAMDLSEARGQSVTLSMMGVGGGREYDLRTFFRSVRGVQSFRLDIEGLMMRPGPPSGPPPSGPPALPPGMPPPRAALITLPLSFRAQSLSVWLILMLFHTRIHDSLKQSRSRLTQQL